jgi:hypothetical protein
MCACFRVLLVIHDSRGYVNDRWPLYIYDSLIGRYPHEEEEEEREEHYGYTDVENRLWECRDGLDIYNPEQRWADNLVPAQHSQRHNRLCRKRLAERTRQSGSRS